jgi:Fic family protein
MFPTGRRELSQILTGMLRSIEPMQVLSGPLGRERVHFEAPPRDGLEAEIARFLTWFNEPKELNNILRACIAHLWFETLHPFEYGNGRIGRAIFDLALTQGTAFHSQRACRLWAVSPFILQHRVEYYSQLESAQRGNLDITEWLLWSLLCIEHACEDARKFIEHVVHIARFWTLNRDTQLTLRQRRLLDLALATDAPDDGWLTAKLAAQQTKVGRVTASRDLARMEELGVIKKDPRAGGRNTRYRVHLPEPDTVRLIKELSWN